MNALELNHVSKQYDTFRLEDVSFTLPAGCIMGLVGENGAGKSTLIRLIMNAAKRDGGTISVLGRENDKPDFVEVKEQIGVVLDAANFPSVLTPKQVDAFLKQSYRQWDSVYFKQLTERFALPWGKMFQDFSRGMKMKLSIAAALAHHPKLLILDEATGGLDPIVRDEILDLFNEFTRDETHSILMSSHIVSDLEKICDYIGFLHQGKLLFCEEKDLLLERYGILHCSKEQLEAVPPEAIKGVHTTPYGVDALVERNDVSAAFALERPDMETLILLLSKGVRC